MEAQYSVHGLHVSSSFALTGAAEATIDLDALPRLSLRRRPLPELERTWNGARRTLLWRGELGDGQALTLERAANGELRFSYGERARFVLRERMRQLECGARDSAPDWQRALISKVLPSISVIRGYEALHAAAVDSPRGVVAFMGASGAGKSTLAFELVRRGWPLFADDQLTLGIEQGSVLAYPGTPHMNVAATAAPGSTGSTLAFLAGERWMAARHSAQRPRRVRMLCVLRRDADLRLEAQPLDAHPLALAPYMLGLPSAAERERSRFNLFADLTASSELISLTAGFEDTPEQLADLVERRLATPSRQVAEVAG
jgi:hypothetical protein